MKRDEAQSTSECLPEHKQKLAGNNKVRQCCHCLAVIMSKKRRDYQRRARPRWRHQDPTLATIRIILSRNYLDFSRHRKDLVCAEVKV